MDDGGQLWVLSSVLSCWNWNWNGRRNSSSSIMRHGTQQGHQAAGRMPGKWPVWSHDAESLGLGAMPQGAFLPPRSDRKPGLRANGSLSHEGRVAWAVDLRCAHSFFIFIEQYSEILCDHADTHFIFQPPRQHDVGVLALRCAVGVKGGFDEPFVLCQNTFQIPPPLCDVAFNAPGQTYIRISVDENFHVQNVSDLRVVKTENA